MELDPGLNVRANFKIPDSSGKLPSEVGYTTTYATTGVGTASPATGQTQVYQPAALEFYKKDVPSSGWIHVSYISKENNRKRALKFDGKEYTIL